MRRIILTMIVLAILISPIQASANSFKATMETRYEKALVQIINLLMQRVQQLMIQLEELKKQQAISAPTPTYIQPQKTVEKPKQILEKKIAPKPYVRPNSNYIPATPSGDRCHIGSIDIKKTDKNCK